VPTSAPKRQLPYYLSTIGLSLSLLSYFLVIFLFISFLPFFLSFFLYLISIASLLSFFHSFCVFLVSVSLFLSLFLRCTGHCHSYWVQKSCILLTEFPSHMCLCYSDVTASVGSCEVQNTKYLTEKFVLQMIHFFNNVEYYHPLRLFSFRQVGIWINSD